MNLTPQQYTDAEAWLADPRAQPITPLPEYAQLSGAIGALKPLAPSPITQRPFTAPTAVLGATQADPEGHQNRVGWTNAGQAYLRELEAIELVGQSTLRLYSDQRVPFGQAFTVTITFDGAGVVATQILATDRDVLIPFDSTKVPDGDYLVGAAGLPPGWSVAEVPMIVKNTTTVKQTTMLVVAASHHVKMTSKRFASTRVPAAFAPVTVPLPDRAYPPITWSAITSVSQLVYTMLAPVREDDVYRPGLLPNGYWTACNREAYYYSDVQGALPPWQVLSGPRGRGSLTAVTSIRETGRPTGGKCTGTDPWRAWACDNDGTIRTLAGYEHPSAVYANTRQFTHWEGKNKPVLIGDWSAIPAARQGFHELWDIAWYAPSLVLDQSAAPIGGEQPHLYGPVAFVTDTQNGRVCKLQFQKNVRGPAVVTEFITGLNKPWGCDFIGDTLYVSEQGGNRIQGYDVHTGAVVWSMAYTRPEGLRAFNGKLYVGSRATSDVKIIDPANNSVTKFADVPCDGNSLFVNLAVGPNGEVATVTWSNTQQGWPVVFDPSGNRLPAIASYNSAGQVVQTCGPVRPTGTSPYPTAVSLGAGRMTWATVQEGLHRLSLALPGDALPSAAALAGAQKWKDLDLNLPYGDNGFGFYGLPVPFGQYGPEVDAYLQSHGH